MSRRVVISGDDFGMSEAFSIGALRALQMGAVSALDLMVNLPSSEFAVRTLRSASPSALPDALALHLNLVLGAPVSDPSSIPSLVDEEGMFFRSGMWHGDDPDDAKCHGSVYPSPDDVSREVLAQIERFRELTGSYPMHIDSHSVMVEPVARGLHVVAAELGIRCEGSPQLVPEIMRTCGECMPAGGNRERMAITSRGSTVEDWLNDAFGIERCPFDIAVVHAHPGYLDQELLDSTSLTLPRCRDYQTLTDQRVIDWFAERQIEPVTYAAVYPNGFTSPEPSAVELLMKQFGVSVR